MFVRYLHAIETQVFESIANVRLNEVETLLITIHLNFPSIVRHAVLCWLSSRHFNIQWPFARGRSSASSPFRTHQRPTAARKCESKWREREKKRETRGCSIRATSPAGKEDGVFAQTIVLSFLLTFIIATLCSFPVEITYLLPQTAFRVFLSCFSPQWLEYIDAQPGEPLFAASAISCFYRCILPAYSFTPSRKLAVSRRPKH